MDTQLLFGCWVGRRIRELEERSDRSVSRSDVLAELGRTDEWLTGVEIGVVLPSTAGFEDLHRALQITDDAESPIRVFSNLDINPWGKEARDLRRQFHLSTPRAELRISGSNESDASVAYFSQVAYRDKLLSVGPTLSLLATAAVFALQRPWSNRELSFIDFNIEEASVIGIAMLGALVLMFGQVSSTIDKVVLGFERINRLSERRKALLTLRQDEHQLGASAWYRRGRGWLMPEDRPYTIPNLFDSYERRAIEAELCERMILVGIGMLTVSVYGTILAFGNIRKDEWRIIGAVFSDFFSTFHVHSLWPLVFWALMTLATFVAVIFHAIRIGTSARYVNDFLSKAYGRSSSPPPVEIGTTGAATGGSSAVSG